MNFDFKILTDEVVENDLFTDKTHEKSSDTLFKVISASEKNITIGLEGAWGAGKSTVINMLNQKFKQDTQQRKTLFFLFDAWAHKDDPLRRIFLESLIEKIKENNSTGKELDKIHKEIVGKIKTIDITAHKTVSPLGKYLAFSAMVVPLGTVLIRTVKTESLGLISFGSPINWIYCFGFLLVIAPILVLIYWFFLGEDQKPKQKSSIVGNKKNWDFFTKESTETIKQDVTEQGEKTSIEFQRYFDEIIKVGFSKYEYKQVVIVIDNLDRVDSDQAKSVWSTLQTFFQSRSLSSDINQKEKMIFIVPYDKEGFSAIWSKESNANNEIASSFLDKCFQVRVEVPQPISSGWLNYCEQCINEALIGWNTEKKIQIKKEYSKILTSNNKIPTPRQIRSWVNQVGMNGYKWGGSFSTKSLAIYSYERLYYSEKELLNKLLDSNSLIYKMNNGLDLVYEISGLLFGVDKERGAEILIHKMIEKCFENIDENKGELKGIVEKHQEVFWLNWNNTKENIISQYSEFDNAGINNLTDYMCFELGDYSIIQDDLKLILKVWMKSSERDWKLTNGWGYADTINILIEKLGRNDADITWLNSFIKKLIIYVVNGIDKLDGDIVKELRKLIDLVKSYNKPIENIICPKLNKENWSKWVKVTNDYSSKFPEIYPNLKELDIWINKIFDTPSTLLSEDFNLLICTFNIVREEFNWNSTIEKMVTLLGNLNYLQRRINVDEIYNLAYLILCEFSNEKLENAIKNPIFSQTVQNEDLNLVPSVKYLLAMVYKEKLITENEVRTEIKEYWLSISEQKITETLKFLSKTSSLFLINILARDSNNKLAQYILNQKRTEIDFTSNSNDYRFVDDVCININNEVFSKEYIESLCKNACIDNELATLTENPIPYFACFDLLFKFGTITVKNKLIQVINEISTPLWLQDLKGNKGLISLFNHSLVLDHKFSEAFGEWLYFSLLNEDDTQDKIWESFQKIEGHILDKHNFYQKIKSIFFENTIFWSNNSVEHVAKFWSDISDIEDQYIIEKLNQWVDAQEWKQIEWVVNLLENNSLRSEILRSRVRSGLAHEHISTETKLMLEHLLQKIFIENIVESLES